MSDRKDFPDGNAVLPAAEVGQVAELSVSSIQSIGTFLDWGKPKDLFLPFSEQTRQIYEGDKVVVFLYVDNNQRSCASMKIDKFMDRTRGNLMERDQVNLFIISETDLGFKAVINGQHLGVLYRNEIFKPIRVGQTIVGFIKKIRDDGKIDLSLQKNGYKAFADVSEVVLSMLERRGGFLPVCDKSPAEMIYDLFGVSKKKFKMTIGVLYKKNLIKLEDDGISLN
jgi:predicted RNA-binding protein (virulence factor B family)